MEKGNWGEAKDTGLSPVRKLNDTVPFPGLGSVDCRRLWSSYIRDKLQVHGLMLTRTR